MPLGKFPMPLAKLDSFQLAQLSVLDALLDIKTKIRSAQLRLETL